VKLQTNFTLGATTGTPLLESLTLSLPNATALSAGSAVTKLISCDYWWWLWKLPESLYQPNAGNISANGNLTIDRYSTLTGNVNANSGVIATTNTTASLFNTTTATTLYLARGCHNRRYWSVNRNFLSINNALNVYWVINI